MSQAGINTDIAGLRKKTTENESAITSVTVDVLNLQTQIDNIDSSGVIDLALKENLANKNATNGYVGKSGNDIIFKSYDGTVSSILSNDSASAQIYTFQDKSGTIADLEDIIASAETVETIGIIIKEAVVKVTPIDGDSIPLADSEESHILKKLSWLDLKATVKTYFDTIYQTLLAKDATGGYVGLTLFSINFKNVANTVTSFFTNTNTAARTYTFQNRNGTILDNANLVTGATDNAILRADGAGGVTTQGSVVIIDDTGRIGIQTTPTASIHIKAGTTAASSAPIKMNTGSLMTTGEAGAIEFLTDQIYFTQTTNSLRKQISLKESIRVASIFSKTNDSTLANVTGLTANLAAGNSYNFRATLHLNADTVGGFKVGIAGTATASSITYQVLAHAITTGTQALANGRINALASSVSLAGNDSYFVQIEGVIICNAAGTLTVQFAQSVATPATTSSVLVHSTFIVENIL